jgi:signal-transduction protein with cAMP-binding, CBS, and nucleotidyltransferase domain
MAEKFNDYMKQLELISKIPYLCGYHFEDKKTLAHLAYFQSYSPEEIVIQEGEINQCLYFLIKGKVNIEIGGKYLKTFQGSGYLFGEMSLINHTLATATVKAQNEIVMLCIEIKDIFALTEEKYFRLQKELYRSVAEILTQKLIATNKIASTYIHKKEETDF